MKIITDSRVTFSFVSISNSNLRFENDWEFVSASWETFSGVHCTRVKGKTSGKRIWDRPELGESVSVTFSSEITHSVEWSGDDGGHAWKNINWLLTKNFRKFE